MGLFTATRLTAPPGTSRIRLTAPQGMVGWVTAQPSAAKRSVLVSTLPEARSARRRQWGVKLDFGRDTYLPHWLCVAVRIMILRQCWMLPK